MPPTRKQPDISSDFRLYLEEKFKNVHEQLAGINEKTKDVVKSVNVLSETVEAFKDADRSHYALCPNTRGLEILEEKMNEFIFIKKYYKVFLIAGLVTLAGFTFTGVSVWYQFKEVTSENNKLRHQYYLNKEAQDEVKRNQKGWDE